MTNPPPLTIPPLKWTVSDKVYLAVGIFFALGALFWITLGLIAGGFSLCIDAITWGLVSWLYFYLLRTRRWKRRLKEAQEALDKIRGLR